MSRAFDIQPARTRADIAAARELMQAYAAGLPFGLGYQDFSAELEQLPGKYAPPGGELLLARGADGTPLGCVALRPLEPAGVCEMKRLYVAPAGRGLGLGRALAEASVEAARTLGYTQMWLDTVPDLTAAIGLYRAMGFEEIAPYSEGARPETLFMGLRL